MKLKKRRMRLMTWRPYKTIMLCRWRRPIKRIIEVALEFKVVNILFLLLSNLNPSTWYRVWAIGPYRTPPPNIPSPEQKRQKTWNQSRVSSTFSHDQTSLRGHLTCCHICLPHLHTFLPAPLFQIFISPTGSMRSSLESMKSFANLWP